MSGSAEDEERRRNNARRALEARRKAKREENELLRSYEAMKQEILGLKEERARRARTIEYLRAQLTIHEVQGLQGGFGDQPFLPGSSSAGVLTPENLPGSSLWATPEVFPAEGSLVSSVSSDTWTDGPQEDAIPVLPPSTMDECLADSPAGAASSSGESKGKRRRSRPRKNPEFSYRLPPQGDPELEARRVRAIKAWRKRQTTKAQTQELEEETQRIKEEVQSLLENKEQLEEQIQKLEALLGSRSSSVNDDSISIP